MIPDLINGCFELAGSIFIWLNIKRLHKDKQVKGVNWFSVAYFAAWGGWNLFYYPHLGQWLSFIGGVSIFSLNIVWVYMLWYYDRKG